MAKILRYQSQPQATSEPLEEGADAPASVKASSSVPSTVDEFTSKVREARSKGFIIGALVKLAKKAEAQPGQSGQDASWRIEEMNEDTTTLRIATVGRAEETQKVSTKSLIEGWRLSNEKIGTHLEGWQHCWSTDLWKADMIKLEVRETCHNTLQHTL